MAAITNLSDLINRTTGGNNGATAGEFGITVGRPLIVIPLSLSGCGSVRDLIAGLPGIIEIVDNSCISFIWLSNAGTAPQIYGSFHTVEK